MFIGTLFVRIPEQKQPNIHKYYDKDIIAYSGNTIVLEWKLMNDSDSKQHIWISEILLCERNQTKRIHSYDSICIFFKTRQNYNKQCL